MLATLAVDVVIMHVIAQIEGGVRLPHLHVTHAMARGMCLENVFLARLAQILLIVHAITYVIEDLFLPLRPGALRGAILPIGVIALREWTIRRTGRTMAEMGALARI
jgi:hypothetical protein